MIKVASKESIALCAVKTHLVAGFYYYLIFFQSSNIKILHGKHGDDYKKIYEHVVSRNILFFEYFF